MLEPAGDGVSTRRTYVPSMATSIIDRVGLGNRRAVDNAEQERLRRRTEDRIVADLVAALADRDVTNRSCSADGTDHARADAVGPAA